MGYIKRHILQNTTGLYTIFRSVEEYKNSWKQSVMDQDSQPVCLSRQQRVTSLKPEVRLIMFFCTRWSQLSALVLTQRQSILVFFGRKTLSSVFETFAVSFIFLCIFFFSYFFLNYFLLYFFYFFIFFS